MFVHGMRLSFRVVDPRFRQIADSALACLSHFPHDYSLFTGQREYRVDHVLISDISRAVEAQDQRDPNTSSFVMATEISDSGMRRFRSLLNGNEEVFTEDNLTELEAIGESLQFNHGVLSRQELGARTPDGIRVGCFPVSLRIEWETLRVVLPRYPTIQIITKKAQYTVPTLTCSVSALLRAQFGSGTFTYDFDDENGIFDLVSRYLRGECLTLVPGLLDSLDRIASDLDLGPLREAISVQRDRLQHVEAALDADQDVIDSHIELQRDLSLITKENCELTSSKVLESGWLSSEEQIQEFVANFLVVSQSRVKRIKTLVSLVDVDHIAGRAFADEFFASTDSSSSGLLPPPSAGGGVE
jgi:hypothetical protein